MRFTPQFLDEIRARLSVSQVVGRKVALKKAGREWRGLSPFKTERTPSFFVNDQKGFYHCFASGAHGDIFKFVMETEGLTFIEAVERLAGEAGLNLPKPVERGPEQAAEADRRVRLQAAVEASARYFQRMLDEPVGRDARQYLERRGLTRKTIAEFGLGYAPAGRTQLKEALANGGFSAPELVEAGMLIGGDDIPTPYDRFRHRIMFPIADARGRLIAFGGRALDPDAPAKYLNSPETPLFSKGSVLFNYARARPSAHDRDRIIAVEGYMDVIALAQAGFTESVAPLGTALTEGQVQLLWRVAAEPVLCFDGDSAGKRAAFRAVDTVLPHLKPGYSVQFAFLPDGLDPDDLVRSQGPEAFDTVLRTRTRRLFDVMIEKEELALGATATPEQRSQLDKRLRTLVGSIADSDVRGHYETELRQVLWERTRREVKAAATGTQRYGTSGRQLRNNAQPDWRVRERQRQRDAASPSRSPGVKSAPASPSATNELASQTTTLPLREALLLHALLNHPWLIVEAAEEIAELEFTNPALQELRNAMLAAAGREISLDRASLSNHLTQSGLAKVVALVQRAITHKGDKFAEPEADRVTVETGWTHTVALHRKDGLRRELALAEQVLQAEASEEAFARVCELVALINQSEGVESVSMRSMRGGGNG